MDLEAVPKEGADTGGCKIVWQGFVNWINGPVCGIFFVKRVKMHELGPIAPVLTPFQKPAFATRRHRENHVRRGHYNRLGCGVGAWRTILHFPGLAPQIASDLGVSRMTVYRALEPVKPNNKL